LLGYQLLTDGVCDDVLDMVENIASETVIELMQEEKGRQENVHIRKKQKDRTWFIRCAKKHCQ
jgi:hypothetical protein